MEILEDILEITHIEKAQDQKIISLILSFFLYVVFPIHLLKFLF